MIPRTNRKRVNLIVKGTPIGIRALQAGGLLLVTVMVVTGLRFGFKAGQKAASTFCEVPKGGIAADSKPATPGNQAFASVIQKDLENRVKTIPGVARVEREKNSDALQVVLSSDAFFRTGTASLDEGAALSARKIASLLRAFLARTIVEIQGHTDDSPVIRQRNLYRSNWELSTARAASLLHVFEEAGFLKDKLKVVGYGDSRPLVPNRRRNGEKIEENLSKNRRIVLRVIPEGKVEAH